MKKIIINYIDNGEYKCEWEYTYGCVTGQLLLEDKNNYVLLNKDGKEFKKRIYYLTIQGQNLRIEDEKRMSENLNLNLQKYHEILKKYGGRQIFYNKVYEYWVNKLYFENLEDAEKAVEVLESYIIMDKLTEE